MAEKPQSVTDWRAGSMNNLVERGRTSSGRCVSGDQLFKGQSNRSDNTISDNF